MLSAAELDRVCIVLVGSRNPLNIGAAARAMSNFGFRRLRVVHPYPVAFREAKSAVDAASILTTAEEFGEVPESTADCALVAGTTGGAGRNLEAERLYRLEEGAGLVRARLRTGSRIALLFGSEKRGLSRQDLSRCHFLLRIPTQTEHPSMNLAQAVAVVLYELIRRPASELLPAIATEPLATVGEKERLLSVLLEALSSDRSAHPGTERLLEEKVRRLVHRQLLTESDLHGWLGLYRRLLWRIRKGDPAPGD